MSTSKLQKKVVKEKILCRICNCDLNIVCVDLGLSPIANDLVKFEDINLGEEFYPLKAMVCNNCWLVQLSYSHQRERIFSSEYPYFSSISTSWLKHAENYVEEIIDFLNLNSSSKIIEIASNDGYLLKNFKSIGAKILGVEPCKNVAEYAITKNQVPTISEFLTKESALVISRQFGKVDLVVANNVLAHVPNTIDFLMGVSELLSLNAVATFEFPHLLSIIKKNQFDTIYHEHYSYLSVLSVQYALNKVGLRIFKIQSLNTHGGSLRVFACHQNAKFRTDDSVATIINSEIENGLNDIETYNEFEYRVQELKCELLSCLIGIKREGKKIVAYGAPAKGNTLLNYCGIGNDFLDYTVDLSPHKQGLYLPGSRLEILSPDVLYRDKPDYILLLPWNLKAEIVDQHKSVRDWGGKFIVPIPNVEII